MDVIFENNRDFQPSPEGFYDNHGGFPFDDDRGRTTGFRSVFDDLAHRHPEFADHLKDPDWGDDFVDSFGRKQRSSGTKEEEKQSGSSDQGANQPEEEEPRQQNLNQYGLRNTVPLAQNINNDSEEERNKRSMSAPPDNRTQEKPKRFVTKCEIPMHDPTQDQGKPPMAPKGPTPEAQKANQPNVRVIPIQVEGRDEPVINTNIDASANFGGETYRDPVFEGRLPRDFGSYRQHSPRFTKKERVVHPQQQPHPQPQPQQHPQPQPQPQQHPQPQPKPQPQPQQVPTDETDSIPKPQPPKPQTPRDPLGKVQVIQKEVDGLAKQVESFNGTSRKDKQYMILDELLTRQLISLDDIDTEGKENVRQARKDTIRSIQRCISTLESKVPLPENSESGASCEEGKTEEQQPMEVDGKQQAEADQKSMDVDQIKTNDSEEPQAKKEKTEGPSSEEQKMDVESEKSVQEQSSDNAK